MATPAFRAKGISSERLIKLSETSAFVGPRDGPRSEENDVIELTDVTKRYGKTVAVRNLTFSVKPGVVTGFLGPNGAGKSTTMRLILGLDAPNSGQALVDGKHYREYPAPLGEVGALLEARSLHPGRSAYNHLLALAQTHGVGRDRVRELIEMVGLSSVARKRAGTFSLGMGQRLGIASALLCDPRVVMFDEPVNGLDVEGIQWVRGLLKQLAAEGRTVFVSSHLMSEMAQTAEHLIVIGRGQLLADMAVDEFVRRASKQSVRVRSPQSRELADLLAGPDVTVEPRGDGLLEINGVDSQVVGETAAAHNIVLYELTPQQASLEEAFVELTRDEVEFHGTGQSPAPELEEAQT
jgi:ABC-2 type transport system ATP-binding protein